MKIILAPDSYKGSLSAPKVCEAMEKGIKSASDKIKITSIPLADGGEGTLEALIQATGGVYKYHQVRGPLGKTINAKWGILGDEKTAVIEMAEASGLTLLAEDQLNPLKASTYGTGELIINALNEGCEKIVLGLGGSATNDGGAGMASALGVKFINASKQEIPLGGEHLKDIKEIDIQDLDPRVLETPIHVACDVTNTLCGPHGATKVFGPQKGANEEDISILDNALAHYGSKIKEYLELDVINYSGSGAAGGMGAGLLAFTGARLLPGIELVINQTLFEKELEDTKLVVTGEGKTDKQTTFGKVPMGVALKAKEKNIPVICISGSLGDGYQKMNEYGVVSSFSILNQPITLEEAIERTPQLIEETLENIIKLWLVNEPSV